MPGSSKSVPLELASLDRWDLPVLAGMIAAGGVAGPILLVLGLARLSGTACSLLLNLEAPFTIALAVAIFREHLSGREAAGVAGAPFSPPKPSGTRSAPSGRRVRAPHSSRTSIRYS